MSASTGFRSTKTRLSIAGTTIVLGSFLLFAGPVQAASLIDGDQIAALIARQNDLAGQLADSATARITTRLERLRDPAVTKATGFDIDLQLDRAYTESPIAPWLEGVEGVALPESYLLDGFILRQSPARQMDLRREYTSNLDLNLWSAGNVLFGREGSGAIDLSRSTASLQSGFDLRPSNDSSVGLAVGINRLTADDDTAAGLSLAGYGSVHPTESTFIDVLAGLEHIAFDLPTSAVFADLTQQSAYQGFSAVTYGYEKRRGRWLVSPYGRIQAFAMQTDPFVFLGSSYLNDTGSLAVAGELSAVAGLRTEVDIERAGMSFWPGFRVEASRDRTFADTALLDLSGLTDGGSVSNQLVLTPSLRAEIAPDWTAKLEHRTTFTATSDERVMEFKLNGRF